MNLLEIFSNVFRTKDFNISNECKRVESIIHKQNSAIIQASSSISSISITNTNQVFLKDLPNLTHIYICRDNLHLVIENCPQVTHIAFPHASTSQNIIIEYVKQYSLQSEQ